MNVTAIMATCGRHLCSERSLSSFLRQSYRSKHLLIFQNSEVYQKLDPSVDRKLVTLVNNHIDSETGKPYTNLGAIYNDALRFLPDETDVVNFWDDDDLHLSDHIQKGVLGLKRSGKLAYKPAFSLCRNKIHNFSKESNVFEPSIFVKLNHVLKYGFAKVTTSCHFKWLNPLIEHDNIYVDPIGKSTLVYVFGELSSYHTSYGGDSTQSFGVYRSISKQHGDRIISPPKCEAMFKLLEIQAKRLSSISQKDKHISDVVSKSL